MTAVCFFVQVVPVCSIVDNIDVDVVTGDLWVTGHGDADLLIKYLKSRYTSISPSQVNHVTSVISLIGVTRVTVFF